MHSPTFVAATLTRHDGYMCENVGITELMFEGDCTDVAKSLSNTCTSTVGNTFASIH